MIALLALLTRSAAADPSDIDALFAEARLAEDQGRYDAAVTICREVLARDPDGARGPTCGRRVAFLERRRDADGAFAGWSELEAVRREFRSADPDAARARVEAIAADPDTTAVVRAEASAWLARRALQSGDPERARIVTERLFTEPGALDALGSDPAIAQQVRSLRATALARLGQGAEAEATEAPIRIPAEGAERPTPVQQALRERRNRAVSWAAAGALGAFGLALAAAGLGRSAPWPSPRTLAPWGLVPIGLAALGGWALAAGWAHGAGAAFPWMLAGFAAIHLLALPALARLEARPGLRLAVRATAALATLAVSWLALWWTDTLPWVGL